MFLYYFNLMANITPKIWGPHYWFFFHTIAFNYPNNPNEITKKIYYEFVHNIPIFLPDEEIANDFSLLLNQYPIQPYLDNKTSFIRWFWFIHNKINEKLEKPSISLNDFYIKYYENNKPDNIKKLDYYKIIGKSIYILFMVFLCFLIYYCYDK